MESKELTAFENDSYGQVLAVTYTQGLEKEYVFIANSFAEFIKYHVKKGNRGFHFTQVDFKKINNDLD